jgi:small-conductance mechanosensitive channel/CRP-like cAMP-binding protein
MSVHAIAAGRLAAPVIANVVAGLVCAVVLGSPAGWLATERAAHEPLVAYGLPFAQFVLFGFLLDRMVRLAAQITDASRPNHPFPRLLLQISTVVIYFTALSASISLVFEQSLGPLLAASGIAGLAVGFALKGIISDIFSGIALHMDASIQTGDWIDFQDRGQTRVCRLMDIQWRSTVLKDRMNNLVIVPNTVFASTLLVNRSRPSIPSEYNVSIEVGSEYEVSRVRRILENALARSVADGVLLAEPAPSIRLGGLAEGLVTYRLFYCLDCSLSSPPRAVDSVVANAVHFLKAAGIPLYPVHNHAWRRPERPGAERLHLAEARVRVLSGVPFLGLLSADELAALASAATLRQVEKGEVVLSAGEDGESMMVLAEGLLEVVVDAAAVGRVWPGECLGEMSLLTGAPRSATVIAAQRSVLIEVHQNAIRPLLEANPSLVNGFAEMMETRRGATHRALGALSGGAEDEASTASGARLVSAIRRLFRLS